MTHTADPTQMPSEARLTEVAGILAAGYVRHRLKERSQNSLDLDPQDGAHMVSVVNRNRARERP